MGTLRDWLPGRSLERFETDALRKTPVACPGVGASAVSALSWEALDALLASEPAPKVKVVRRGRLLPLPAPRSLSDLRALFAHGIGIVVEAPEQHSSTLMELTVGVKLEVPGEQRVLVFATPAGQHGFAWHYDVEDVFIVQTEGDKEYYFRENTLDPHPVRSGLLDFRLHRLEQTPLMSCRLLMGDFLYLPQGYWHVAHPHSDSLSLSIGVYTDEHHLASLEARRCSARKLRGKAEREQHEGARSRDAHDLECRDRA